MLLGGGHLRGVRERTPPDRKDTKKRANCHRGGGDTAEKFSCPGEDFVFPTPERLAGRTPQNIQGARRGPGLVPRPPPPGGSDAGVKSGARRAERVPANSQH